MQEVQVQVHGLRFESDYKAGTDEYEERFIDQFIKVCNQLLLKNVNICL